MGQRAESWRSHFSREAIDFTETRTFVAGLVQVGLAIIEFGLLFWLAATFHVISPSTLDPNPPSPMLVLLLGFIPAVLLGALYPFLIQRREFFERLDNTRTVRVVGPILTFGTYVLLFFFNPVSSVFYAIVYLVGRASVLVGMYTIHRI